MLICRTPLRPLLGADVALVVKFKFDKVWDRGIVSAIFDVQGICSGPNFCSYRVVMWWLGWTSLNFEQARGRRVMCCLAMAAFQYMGD